MSNIDPTLANSLSTPLPSSSNPRRFSFWLPFNGVLLIALGILFLSQVTFFKNDNWWSVFILLPALGFLWTAGTVYHFCHNVYNFWVRFHLSVGIIVLAVAVIFALGLNWRYAWTLMLVVPGLAIFLNGFTWPRQRFGTPAGGAANLQFWLGTSIVLLGVTFLLNQLGLINLSARFGTSHWWWPFILIPGIGGLINSLAIRSITGPSATANALLALGVVLSLDAGAEYLALSWTWRVPMALIIGGLVLLIAEFSRK
jgi:hypothetical protein